MSEFTGTRCDSCGKLTEVETIDVVDELEWEEDDMGGHACPDCQGAAANLEANTAGGEDLAVFGETLTKTADAVLESPEVIKLKAERLAAFKKIKKEALRDVRAEMKKAGQSEEQIKDALDDLDVELEERFKLSFTYKTEA